VGSADITLCSSLAGNIEFELEKVSIDFEYTYETDAAQVLCNGVYQYICNGAVSTFDASISLTEE
jgi:hypothetical protein